MGKKAKLRQQRKATGYKKTTNNLPKKYVSPVKPQKIKNTSKYDELTDEEFLEALMLFAVGYIMETEELTEEEATDKVVGMVKTEDGLIDFLDTFAPKFIEKAEKFAQEIKTE